MTFLRRCSGVSLFAAAILIVSVAPAQQRPPVKAKSALDKTTLEAYVRHLFVWGPQIQVKISDPKPSELPGFLEVSAHASAGAAQVEQRLYLSKDGRKIIQGSVYDVGQNPFQKQVDRLRADSLPRSGEPNAPVAVVVLSDFQCPFCKDEAKMLRENLVSTYPKQVRLHFKDLPLESIHPWAKPAAMAGRCIYRQNADVFWQYHDWVFENQKEITPENLKAKVIEFAAGKPIDALQLGRCIDNRETEAEVDRSVADAKELRVNSTPTVFINGRMLTGRLAWPQLRNLIDFELEYLKKTGTSSDCDSAPGGCEVKLPLPSAK